MRSACGRRATYAAVCCKNAPNKPSKQWKSWERISVGNAAAAGRRGAKRTVSFGVRPAVSEKRKSRIRRQMHRGGGRRGRPSFRPYRVVYVQWDKGQDEYGGKPDFTERTGRRIHDKAGIVLLYKKKNGIRRQISRESFAFSAGNFLSEMKPGRLRIG